MAKHKKKAEESHKINYPCFPENELSCTCYEFCQILLMKNVMKYAYWAEQKA